MIIKELKELNSKNVLSYITQEEIYRFYLAKNFRFNTPFSSPFRVDKNPSFVISNKNYRYKDFAMGDSGNCFNFVMQLFNINYNLALIQIVTDFNIRSNFHIVNPTGYNNAFKRAEVKNLSTNLYTGTVSLKIKQREWEQYDLDYWQSYGISLTYLRLGWIFPISHFFLNDKCYRADKLSYAYIEKKDNKITYKIYQPKNTFKKFISGNTWSTWELWHLLPQTGEDLIITSSRKDALSIIENLQVPAVSFQAESIIPKDIVLKEVLKRFKRVFLFYDNDTHKAENNGQKMALKLVSKYPELINIKIPDEYNSKDFSDFINQDKNLAIKIIKEIIK